MAPRSVPKGTPQSVSIGTKESIADYYLGNRECPAVHATFVTRVLVRLTTGKMITKHLPQLSHIPARGGRKPETEACATSCVACARCLCWSFRTSKQAAAPSATEYLGKRTNYTARGGGGVRPIPRSVLNWTPQSVRCAQPKTEARVTWCVAFARCPCRYSRQANSHLHCHADPSPGREPAASRAVAVVRVPCRSVPKGTPTPQGMRREYWGWWKRRLIAVLPARVVRAGIIFAPEQAAARITTDSLGQRTLSASRAFGDVPYHRVRRKACGGGIVR